MAGNKDDDRSEWVHLATGKEFSRLLYPNPVCFLSTIHSKASSGYPGTDDAGSNIDGGLRNAGCDRPIESGAKRNVMVLSWLAPTNNQGRFMFSINRGRYTASLLAPCIGAAEEGGDGAKKWRTGIEFALSVPVKGMEQLVLDVGSVSGKFGTKFPATQEDLVETDTIDDAAQMSNRQRKKMRRERLSREGVRGLVPVQLGSSHPLISEDDQSSTLFAIQGTVAQLKCRTYAVSGTVPSPEATEKATENSNATSRKERDDHLCDGPPIIDDGHLLVMAEVIDAYVQISYWDGGKLLFRPQDDAPPYLTFFGSQTFGYVTAGDASMSEC